MIGQTVSHYRILERLGGGGMGVVYRALDTRLDRIVALKFLPAEWSGEPLLRERFSREARAASALDHPNICTIFDIGESPAGQLFIAMAYCPGETLKQRIQRGPVAINDAVDIAIQLCGALQEAHNAGIVHRDIKPANILITDRNQVKIVDFGLAKHAGELAVTRQGSVIGTPAYMSPEQARGDDVDGRAVTRQGSVIGTPAYMSPEQARGDDVDGRSDIWAIGAVLYEMLAGRRAFSADHESAILLAITSTDPTSIEDLRPEVPAELLRIVRRCLKRNIGERYQNAGQLLVDLRRFRGEATPAEIATVTLPSAPTAQHRMLFKHRLLPALAAVAAVALVATLYPTLSRTGTRHLLVLPFNCPGNDAESQLLCIGLLDAVSAKLTELRRFQSSLAVVPASEVRDQRVQSADMAHRIFGVDLVVSGTILRENDSLRIPIELVDATRLRQLRSRTITTDETAGFVLQDRVVAAVEEMLDVELGAEERKALMAGGTRSAEAGELYLEARGRAGESPSETQLTRAMALYRQALDLDPDYAEALVQLADACHQRYQLSQDPIWLQHGADYARRAVAVEPELPAAQLTAGRFELANSAYGEAIDHLQRAITLDPLGLIAYMYLAQAYEELGEPDTAEATVERAIRTGPEDWQTYYDLGVFFYQRNEWERAAGYFGQVVELLPEHSIGYTALGGTLFYLDDREGARMNLERAIEIGCGYDGYNNLATLNFFENRYVEAAALFERALELDDRDYTVWNNLAESLAEKDQPDTDGARAALVRAAAMAAQQLVARPDSTVVIIDLASLKIQLGEEGDARPLVDRALDLGVDDPNSMIALADIYEKLGERDAALVWIDRSLKAGYPLQIINDYPGFDDLKQDPRFKSLADDAIATPEEKGT